MNSVLLFSLRNFQKKKAQTGALGLCLLLSVGLCSLVVLLSVATFRSFEKSVKDLATDTDLIITLDDSGFPKDTLDKVLDLKMVEQAVPLLRQKVFMHSKSGKKVILSVIGIDLLNESNLSHSTGKNAIKDPLAFMANPLSVALPEDLLRDKELKLDEKLRVLTPDGERELLVSASFASADFSQVFGANVALMDIEAAGLLMKREGKLDQINVKLREGISPQDGAKMIRAAIGNDYTTSPPSQMVDNLKNTVKPFQFMLLFMASLTFILVLYLVMNLSSNTLDERRKELGILRAIGCSRGHLATLVFGELTILTTVSSVSGSTLAWLIAPKLAKKLNYLVASKFGASIDLAPSDFELSVALLIALAASVVVVATLARSVLRILNVSPTETITSFVQEKRSSAPVRVWTGVLFAVFCVPLLFKSLPSWAHALPLLAGVFLGPSLIILFLMNIGKLRFIQSSGIGRLAWEYSKAEPRSVGKKTRGILISLLLLFTVTLVRESFKAAMIARFERATRPDMFITANSDLLSPFNLQPLDESLAPELGKIPGVFGVYGQRIVKIRYRGQTVSLRAVDEVPPTNKKLRSPYSYFDIVDRPSEDAGYELYHGEHDDHSANVLVSESLANYFGYKTGDHLVLTSPGGKIQSKIVGIIREISAGIGAIYIPRVIYRKWWDDPLVSGMAVSLNEDADELRVKSAIEERFSEKYGIVVTTDRKLQDDLMRAIERSFFYMDWINYLILIVTLINFIGTFLFDIKARARQFATLRSIGMTKKVLQKMVLTETVFLTGSSVLLAFLISVPVAWRLITSGITSALGWYMAFHFDLLSSLSLITMALGITSLAGWFPAYRASSVQISEALQTE